MDEKERSVTVDISKWRMKDRLEFNKLSGEDDEKVMDFILEKGVVTAWSFEGDPADKQAWLDLPLEAFSFIFTRISGAMQDRFRKGV